jgi:phosphatidylserine decarboxylase
VNRTPISGKITKIIYKPGKFLVASKEEASSENEMNTFIVEGDGTKVVFSQIAGLIARRIVCWKKVGDSLKTGERVGLIKFGSRMDVVMGPEWEIAIAEGERVSAGSSIIAKRRRL